MMKVRSGIQKGKLTQQCQPGQEVREDFLEEATPELRFSPRPFMLWPVLTYARFSSSDSP